MMKYPRDLEPFRDETVRFRSTCLKIWPAWRKHFENLSGWNTWKKSGYGPKIGPKLQYHMTWTCLTVWPAYWKILGQKWGNDKPDMLGLSCDVLLGNGPSESWWTTSNWPPTRHVVSECFRFSCPLGTGLTPSRQSLRHCSSWSF